MKRMDVVFSAVLLALHVCMIVLLPGASQLSDVEVMSLTGGVLGTGELAASMRTGSVVPHPTPFWIAAGAWAKVTRVPWLLRLPSILTSLLIILLVFHFGTRHLSRLAGMVAATLYALSPAAVGIGRAFSPDCALMGSTLLAVHSLLSAWKRQQRGAWAACLGSMVFMLYWHVYGSLVFIIVSLAVGGAVLWHGKLHRARDAAPPPVGEALVVVGAAALIYAPWFLIVGRHAHLPSAPSPLTPGAFYGIVMRGYGSGSVFGFVPLGIAAVAGGMLGLRTERVSLSSGRVLLSTKTFVPTFFLVVLCTLFVPSLFAVHRTTMTAVSHGGVAALLPLFLLLAALGVSRLIPHSLEAPAAGEFAIAVACAAVLAGLGWTAPTGGLREQASVWEDAASFLDGRVREGEIVLVSPDESKVFMAWASSRCPWTQVVRGENWLSRYDAGPNIERVGTIWWCESFSDAGRSPRVRISRMVKIGGLDLGTPEAVAFYIDGIDTRLEQPTSSSEPFTFSWALGTHAKLDYPLESNRSASVVMFRAEPFSLPQKVTIDLNKRRKAQVEMQGGWHHYVVPFGPPEFLGGSRGRIDLRFATHRPPTSPDGAPWRMKAVALDYIAVFFRQQMAVFPPTNESRDTVARPGRARRTAPKAW